MYQTVGHHAIDLYAEAMDLPLFRRTIKGDSVEQGRDYTENPDDEVEDLYVLLKEVKVFKLGQLCHDFKQENYFMVNSFINSFFSPEIFR